MKKTVRRFDIGQLSSVTRTDQGFVRIPAIATRIGVLKYRKKDGNILLELRHPEEVFNPDSMHTLAGVPVTNDHPLAELVNAKNVRQYMVGFTGENVSRDGQFLKTTATITDAETISEVENGKRELSCGYTCDLEEAPGVYNGERYDVVQRNIRYNHLAIVDKGRAGSEVRLRMDGEDAIFDENFDESASERANNQGDTMNKVKIGDAEYAISDNPLFEAVKKMVEEKDGMQKMYDSLKADFDKLKADRCEEGKKLDALQARVDSQIEELKGLKEKVATQVDEKEINRRAIARMKLIDVAKRVLSAEEQKKFDSMSDLDIKRAVVLAKVPGLSLDGKSDTYLEVRFDHVCETLGAEVEQDIGRRIVDSRKDSKIPTAEEARKKAMERAQEAWKGPLSAVKHATK